MPLSRLCATENHVSFRRTLSDAGRFPLNRLFGKSLQKLYMRSHCNMKLDGMLRSYIFDSCDSMLMLSARVPSRTSLSAVLTAKQKS